jgi:hypothetical protein
VAGSVFWRFDVWHKEGRVEDRVDARILPCLWDVESIRNRSQLSGYGERSKSLGVEFCLGSLSTQVSAFEPDAVSNLVNGWGSV